MTKQIMEITKSSDLAKRKGGKNMEQVLFKAVSQIKDSLKSLGEELNLDILKNLKITLTDNAMTIKIVMTNLEKEEK